MDADRRPPLSFDEAGELRVLQPAQFRHTEELERAGADFAERASPLSAREGTCTGTGLASRVFRPSVACRAP